MGRGIGADLSGQNCLIVSFVHGFFVSMLLLHPNRLLNDC